MGVTIIPWSRGRCAARDFTCPDTLASSHLNRAVNDPGQAEEEREVYQVDCSVSFPTNGIETLGPVGKEATLFIQELGCRISAITHEPSSLSFLWHRLSAALKRGNAACVCGTASSENNVLFLS